MNDGRIVARLRSMESGFPARFESLLAAVAETDPEVEAVVREVVAAVRRDGDSAVLEYTRRFDGLAADALSDLRVPDGALDVAWNAIGAGERAALTEAAARIRDYHERQRQDSWQYVDEDGSVLGQRITPIERVGIYVPGGKASYPSSVLMNAIPARGGRCRGDRDGGSRPVGEARPPGARRREGGLGRRGADHRRGAGDRGPSRTGPNRSVRWTRSSGPETGTWPPPSGSCSAPSAST